MHRKIRKITGFVSTLLLFAVASPPQLDTGTITVSVKDGSGSAVPGAHVALRNENTGVEFAREQRTIRGILTSR